MITHNKNNVSFYPTISYFKYLVHILLISKAFFLVSLNRVTHFTMKTKQMKLRLSTFEPGKLALITSYVLTIKTRPSKG